MEHDVDELGCDQHVTTKQRRLLAGLLGEATWKSGSERVRWLVTYGYW